MGSGVMVYFWKREEVGGIERFSSRVSGNISPQCPSQIKSQSSPYGERDFEGEEGCRERVPWEMVRSCVLRRMSQSMSSSIIRAEERPSSTILQKIRIEV